MKCPVCNTTLARTEYEGFIVQQCPDCHGHLLTVRRLDSIKRKEEKSIEELKTETTKETGNDSLHKLRCPKCKQRMQKRFIPDPGAFHVDRCDRCELIWVDGGELARLQLMHVHRRTAQGRAAPTTTVRDEPAPPCEFSTLLDFFNWNDLSDVCSGASHQLRRSL